MLKTLRTFLNDLAGVDDRHRFSDDDHRLAAAALLFHVIAVDGDVSAGERARLHDILKMRYALDEAATRDLIREAEAADQEAVDLYHFTSVLKTRLDEAGREQIVALMWDLVYQDGKLHEFEENVIWRVAELLGVSTRIRVLLKKQVAGSAAAEITGDRKEMLDLSAPEGS